MGWNGGKGHKESLVRKQMKTFRKNQASRFNMLNINKNVLSEASSTLSRGGFCFWYIYMQKFMLLPKIIF